MVAVGNENPATEAFIGALTLAKDGGGRSNKRRFLTTNEHEDLATKERRERKRTDGTGQTKLAKK